MPDPKKQKGVDPVEKKETIATAKSEAVSISNVRENIPKSPGEIEGVSQQQTVGDGSPEPVESDQKDKDKIAEATKEFLKPDVVGVVVEAVFTGAAKKWGDHWKLHDSEKHNLSEALCNYLNVVLPEFMKNQPELFVLLFTAGVIVIPRGLKNVKKKRKDSDVVPEVHDQAGGKETDKLDPQSVPEIPA